MPKITLRPRQARIAFDKLFVGGFALEVRELTNPGIWSRRERVYQGVTGTAWLTLPCHPRTPQPGGPDIVFRPWLEVVAHVEWPETQISLALAQKLVPDARLGTSIEVPIGLREDRLSAALNEAALKVDWSKDLLAQGRVLVSFTNVAVRRVSGQAYAGTIVEGEARYSTTPHIPKRLEVEIDGFSLELTALELNPKGARADAVLELPANLGDAEGCGPATIDLGNVSFGPDCTLYVERPDQHWGPWILGDTGLIAEGTGFVFDASGTRSPLGHPLGWRGLRLSGGTVSGKNTIPDPCNTGWLGGDFTLDGAVVTPSGLSGTLRLSDPHGFRTLNPMGYEIHLKGAEFHLSASSIASGMLGPGHIGLPTEAVQAPGGGGVKVQFTALSVQPNLDAAGDLASAAALAWGEFTRPGDELEVQAISAKEGLVFLPAGPRRSFLPVRPSGFVSLPFSGPVGHGLAALDSEDAAGVTFRQPERLRVLSPDRPGGLPLEFEQVNGWLRVDTLGLDGELQVPARDVREALGEPARPGYVGGISLDTQLYHREKMNLVGRWVSSANHASDFRGTVRLPAPSAIPDMAFADLNLTSTANLVGGTVALPPGGVELEYWKLDLVPMGTPDEAGVMSVRTGRIVFTATGIHEPVHFSEPFRLTWGEILADGNVGELRFDVSAQGQRFDGLPYGPSNVRLSPYVAGTTDPFLSTCGTVHFNFFGAATVNIRDVRHSETAAPFFGRYVKVPVTGDGDCADTDLHLEGSWQDTNSKQLVDLDFPDADMGYNESLQDGFIGKGSGTLAFLAGGTLDAVIEARSTGIDIHLSSSQTRNLDLGLYAVLGGMSEIKACIRIEDSLLSCINVGGVLETATSSGFGILAPKTGHVVEVNLTVTPSSLDLFAAGSILFQVAASALDVYAQVHVQYDYRRGTAEGEVLGRFDCNSVLAGLEGDGQVTWFVGPGSGHVQGNMRVYLAGWLGKGGMEGGFFVGHNTPKNLAWILQPSSPHFGVSPAILPDQLTGVFGYGQAAFGFNAYLFGGGVELYASLGAFSIVPPGLGSAWALVPGASLPYVVGSCGVHLHGEILGGLVSASGWADLDVRGPVPLYFEGSLGLEGCVLWVLCASVDLTVGLNSGGFYVS